MTHKRKRGALWLLLAFLGLSSSGVQSAEIPELVIYTYDSLVTPHGLGPEIFPLFEKKWGCRIRALPSGDGAQLLTRLQLDAKRGKSVAHVVMGLDQNTFEAARPYLELGKGSPGFVEFDYGILAFMEDRQALERAGLAEPHRLADLLKPEWRRNIILEDPRTSTSGLAFLLYANEVGGAGFWPQFKSQWLTLAPGWDAAYGLFLKKEAPLVWSYTTSQAYHEEHGDSIGEHRRYRALIFDEGQPKQVEGAALIQGAFHSKDPQIKKLAAEFLKFLVSPEVQSRIPLKNWMIPVVQGPRLPPSFEHLPKPLKIVPTPTDARQIERALREWKGQL
ncbi:thiamine ABC transporter substrate-binding protein [Bdellovibrionota bacterium FG-1]